MERKIVIFFLNFLSQNVYIDPVDTFISPLDVILHFFDGAPCSQSVCEIGREYLHR